MREYFAGTIPVMRERKILFQEGAGQASELELDALQVIELLKPGDKLWLMMGATNAEVAFRAFNHGVEVHQISYSRALPIVKGLREQTENMEEDSGEQRRGKISAQDVQYLAQNHSRLFYAVHGRQSEVLQITAAWDRLARDMETRKTYANRVRIRMHQEAVLSGYVQVSAEVNDTADQILRAQNISITPDTKKVARSVMLQRKIQSREELQAITIALLGGKVKVGPKGQRRDKEIKSLDPGISYFETLEKNSDRHLASVMSRSGLYQTVFEPIEGIGVRLAARLISSTQWIERFPTPTDLSNYAGVLPRGRDGKLPSRKRTKRSGDPLARDPALNNACFLIQDQMFGYGSGTPLGRMLHGRINELCPCAQEQRDKDKDLKRRHGEATRQGRIHMTRHLLEKIIWPGWHEYIKNGTGLS